MFDTNNKTSGSLQNSVLRISRLHFIYVFLFFAQSMIYDAWKLITPLSLERRWIMTAILLIVTTLVWYVARNKVRSLTTLKTLVFSLIIVDIAAATFNVYTQRGMASRAVMLYAVPIIVSAVLESRSAIFAAATLSVATYTTATIIYFVEYFNEGLKIELYGEVGFYAALFLVLAAMLWAIVRNHKHHSSG